MGKIKEFFTKYNTLTHFILWVWNAFIVSWATGVVVPLGNGMVLNARTLVSDLQSVLHAPTWIVYVVTLALNAIVFYNNWKNQQGKLNEAGKLLAAQRAKNTGV